MALDMFDETTYSTVENTASRCYVLRALERFATFFGMAELELESGKRIREPYLVRKSALLDSFVIFK